MTNIIELKTSRLKLRQWKPEDRVPFAAMNADPRVMKHYVSTLTAEQSDTLADKLQTLISEHGWGFWALETLAGKEFIGFVGLNRPDYELPFGPCTEIGWRLGTEHQGKGYATEAARAALGFAFNTLKLDEVVSFTALPNKKSEAVMQRLGMQNQQHNFEHPAVPEEHPLREHVLYKITAREWFAKNSERF